MIPVIVSILVSLPVLACTTYLFVLVLLSGRRKAPTPPPPTLRFDIIVPSHNEEAGIAETVTSLLALDYPKDRFRVLVVADNCSDRTADLARAAGATVLERQSATERGKGYALNFAFERVLA